MTPSEFQFKLDNLPANTPITKEHILVILEALQQNAVSGNRNNAYSTWDNDKIIDEKTLAEWIAESPSTIQKWRVKGEGPAFIDKPKRTHYRVGDVRDWLKKRTVHSTAQANMIRTSSLIFADTKWDCFEPVIFVNGQPKPFFETFDEEFNITGAEVRWSQQSSLASLFMSEYRSDPDTVVEKLLNTRANDIDINQTSLCMVGGRVQKRTLAHLVATLPFSDGEQYRSIVIGMIDLGIDFTVPDEEGRNAMELAKSTENEFFVKILSAHNFYWYMQDKLRKKT